MIIPTSSIIEVTLLILSLGSLISTFEYTLDASLIRKFGVFDWSVFRRYRKSMHQGLPGKVCSFLFNNRFCRWMLIGRIGLLFILIGWTVLNVQNDQEIWRVSEWHPWIFGALFVSYFLFQTRFIFGRGGGQRFLTVLWGAFFFRDNNRRHIQCRRNLSLVHRFASSHELFNGRTLQIASAELDQRLCHRQNSNDAGLWTAPIGPIYLETQAIEQVRDLDDLAIRAIFRGFYFSWRDLLCHSSFIWHRFSYFNCRFHGIATFSLGLGERLSCNAICFVAFSSSVSKLEIKLFQRILRFR